VTFVSRTSSTTASPRYATHDDNAIFTGMYLAAASYRYAVTRTPMDLAAGDDNPHFTALHIAWTGEPMPMAAWPNLQRRAADSYHKFYSWEKDPEQWWHEAQETEGPGLDVLLPYWTLRYYAR